MSAELVPIDTVFDDADHVRLVFDDDVPYWVGKDACVAMGISQYRHALVQLDGDERVSMAVHTLGGPQVMVCVNEAGLYSLMFMSRSPKVKPFRRWITHEVIPAIRETGSYQVQSVRKMPEDFPAALRALADECDVRKAIEAKMVEQAPKVEAYDAFLSADGSLSWQAAADILGMGRNTLTKRLKELRVIQHSLLPYARYLDYFNIVPRTFDHPKTGAKTLYHVTEVYPVGIDFLRRKLGL